MHIPRIYAEGSRTFHVIFCRHHVHVPEPNGLWILVTKGSWQLHPHPPEPRNRRSLARSSETESVPQQWDQTSAAGRKELRLLPQQPEVPWQWGPIWPRASLVVAYCYYSSNGLQPTSDGLQPHSGCLRKDPLGTKRNWTSQFKQPRMRRDLEVVGGKTMQIITSSRSQRFPRSHSAGANSF